MQRLTVDVAMRSDVPGADLPPYVYGTLLKDLPRESMRNRVYLYAPAGGQIGDVTADGAEAGVRRAQHGVRPVAFLTIDLAPGETKRLQYVVETGAGQRGDIRVLSTPLADGTGGERFVASACA